MDTTGDDTKAPDHDLSVPFAVSSFFSRFSSPSELVAVVAVAVTLVIGDV